MTRFAYTLFFVLFVATTPLQLQAQPKGHFLQLAAKGQHEDLNAAVTRIKQQTGGRILSAKTVNKKGKAVHHIKVLLPSGKVRVFKVNQ